MHITEQQLSARRGPASHAADFALALVVGMVWWILCSQDGRAEPLWVALIAASSAPLAGWRLAPMPALLISLAAATVLASQDAVQWPPLAPLVALYLVTATSGSRTHVRAVLLPGATALVYLTGTVASGSASVQDLAHATLGFAAAWFAGERTRLRHDQIAALHDRMHTATESRARDAQLAVVEERSRIARDLHDSAGHALNVIAVRAGGARLRNDPGNALVALADIEQIARDTAADIDAIVGSLRDRDEPSRTPIGLASADTLIQQHRDAGLTVTTTHDGNLPALSPAGDQAAFRGLQEALTNAARHGTGSAEVAFSGAGGRFSLTVSNPTRQPSGSGRTPGHGLIGMRERASMLGGTVVVERPAGRFVVRLTLPGIEVAR